MDCVGAEFVGIPQAPTPFSDPFPYKLVMHDFMLPKLIYWPSLLLAMVLISYWALF